MLPRPLPQSTPDPADRARAYAAHQAAFPGQKREREDDYRQPWDQVRIRT